MPYKLVGVGEILWDMLPEGSRLGGAPANFAYHAKALGANARVVSRVGKDDLGGKAIERLGKLGLNTDCLEVDSLRPTGTVKVEIAADGQARYRFPDNVAWDAIEGGPTGRRAVVEADAVCFGTLAQRSEISRATIRTLISTSASSALRIFDINLRQHFYSQTVIDESLQLANALKVNDVELPKLAEMFNLPGNVRDQITELAGRYNLRVVGFTRGSNGSLLFADGKWSDHSGIQTPVVDTIGAGDAFTAAMTLGFLAKWDLDRVNEVANRIAAYVCSCAGATPELPEDLRNPYRELI